MRAPPAAATLFSAAAAVSHSSSIPSPDSLSTLVQGEPTTFAQTESYCACTYLNELFVPGALSFIVISFQ
jgi:hypothetical protein